MTIFFRILRFFGKRINNIKTRYNKWNMRDYLIRSGAQVQNFDGYTIATGAKIYAAGKLKIGSGLVIGERSEINSNDSFGIYIGDNLLLASDVYIRAGNHDWSFSKEPFQKRGHCAKKVLFNGDVYSIVIEDNVWIGHGATIISGAHIGEGCVVGANAVVAGEIPPYSVVIGNPTQIVSNRQKHKSFEGREDLGLFD